MTSQVAVMQILFEIYYLIQRTKVLVGHRLVVRAEQAPQEPSPSPVDEEARLEALEASVRTKRGVRNSAAASSRRAESSGSRYAEWKEGQLFPEGWDQMDPIAKFTEIYLGQRGILFWSTKLATNGVIALAVAWALFRFVGPALGLYQLTNDISTPNF